MTRARLSNRLLDKSGAALPAIAFCHCNPNASPRRTASGNILRVAPRGFLGVGSGHDFLVISALGPRQSTSPSM
jgi:hypothetical protein